MYDTVSGIRDGDYGAEDTIAEIIRYPKQISLLVRLDPNHDEMIYVPLLIIDYRERTSSYIQESSLTEVQFNTEYALNTD